LQITYYYGHFELTEGETVGQAGKKNIADKEILVNGWIWITWAKTGFKWDYFYILTAK
jgi:hypothetical protein